MKIISNQFENGGRIPKKYTCNGDNINPPLSFIDVPENTKSLALIMYDPDVPRNFREDGMWNHWIIWNIAPTINEILEGKAPEALFGVTTSGVLSYGGPCPPDREHRYFFKLYALDTELDLEEGSTREELEKAMNGHVIEYAELIGLYEQY